MIKYSEIQNIFGEKGINAIEYNYETDEEIVTPFIVYVAVDSTSFNADSINYIKMLNIRMALIDEFINNPVMGLIEQTFNDNSVTYEKAIDFDNESRLYSTQYSFTVIDG